MDPSSQQLPTKENALFKRILVSDEELLPILYYRVEDRVILYFSVVRGVERYEHASLAAALKKKS